MDKVGIALVYSFAYYSPSKKLAAGKTHFVGGQPSRFVFRCSNYCNRLQGPDTFFSQGRCVYQALA